MIVPNAILVRQSSNAEGTFGVLSVGNSSFASGELPWRSNNPGVSCIPPGVYPCAWTFSAKHGRNVYHLFEVPGRDSIEIHPGNFCGDATIGFKSDVQGCIILGLTRGEIEGQACVKDSKKAVKSFEEVMKGLPFELTVKWGEGVCPKEAV